MNDVDVLVSDHVTIVAIMLAGDAVLGIDITGAGELLPDRTMFIHGRVRIGMELSDNLLSLIRGCPEKTAS